MDRAQFALLSYETSNLGDEIQSIAARQFLPAVDILVDRDRPQLLPPGTFEGCKIIFNGWHTRNPENWPPAFALRPLLISVHLTAQVHTMNKSGRIPSDALVEGNSLEYLRAHQPVGARDLWTRDLLRARNIDSDFSACLTLTLGDGDARVRGEYVCAVDLDEPALSKLRALTKAPIVTTTHYDATGGPFSARMRKAEQLLNLYAHARCVVATRLHSALPCLALQTPVLFVVWARDTYRFTGLREMLRRPAHKEFLDGAFDFDFDHPSPNAATYKPYRDALIRRTNMFIDARRVNSGTPLHPFRSEIPAVSAI